MATLTPTLTFSSTDTATDQLSFAVSSALTVTTPNIDIARLSVPTAKPSILTASNSTTTYVYAKTTDSTNHVKLYTGNDELFGIVWPGEFAFFAVVDGEGLKFEANNAAVVMEYGYWTKG